MYLKPFFFLLFILVFTSCVNRRDLPLDGGPRDLAADRTDGLQGFEVDSPTKGSDVLVPSPDSPLVDLSPDVSPTDVPVTQPPDSQVVDTHAIDSASDRPDDAVIEKPEVAATVRAWSSPITVQNSTGGAPLYEIDVAVSPVTGDAVVVWVENTLGLKSASYMSASNSWEASVVLESQGIPIRPRVAVDGSGHYVVVWGQSGGQNQVPIGIWASYSDDGKTWTKPVQIAVDEGKAWYSDIRIGMNRSGQARVVWDRFVSPADPEVDRHILYSTYLEGTNPAPVPKKISTESKNEFSPRLAIDKNGNGLLVWTEPDTTVMKDSVWGMTFAKATLGTPRLVENYDANWAGGPEVATNSDGQFIVIWQEIVPALGGDKLNLNSRRYTVKDGWAAASEPIASEDWAGNMSLTMDSQGTASLGWANKRKAMFATATLGGAWKTESVETVDSAGVYDLIDPVVRMDGSGNVLMAWKKKTGTRMVTPHFRWRLGAQWNSESEINAIPELFSASLRMGVSDDGLAVAAWTYDQCDAFWSNNADICPGYLPYSSLDATSKKAKGSVFVSVYR